MKLSICTKWNLTHIFQQSDSGNNNNYYYEYNDTDKFIFASQSKCTVNLTEQIAFEVFFLYRTTNSDVMIYYDCDRPIMWHYDFVF